jgi:hypothetical protein
LGAVVDGDMNIIKVYDSPDLLTASETWLGETSEFRSTYGAITYEIKISDIDISTATPDLAPLKYGNDGSLRNDDGSLNVTTAVQCLAQGYGGVLTNPVTGNIEDTVLDTDNYFFSLIFDAGYDSDVKEKIVELAQNRGDCMAILDNGDNYNVSAAISSRTQDNTYNSYFAVLYEQYSKVYDMFTGQDIWVSPMYHMSRLIPMNDSVGDIWNAVAGFGSGSINNIKELRYNPKQTSVSGERDQLYLKQLNPIVKFPQGYVVWGQLTTQTKPSAMQDMNIVRLVLYVKKALENYALYYIFQLNDSRTWSEVANEVSSFLSMIKSRRGLYSFAVDVGATAYEIKRKQFHIDVTLYPTRVVEQVLLNIFVK